MLTVELPAPAWVLPTSSNASGTAPAQGLQWAEHGHSMLQHSSLYSPEPAVPSMGHSLLRETTKGLELLCCMRYPVQFVYGNLSQAAETEFILNFHRTRPHYDVPSVLPNLVTKLTAEHMLH